MDNEKNELELVELEDENGASRVFEIVDRAVLENNEYFALVPCEPNEDDDEEGTLVILKTLVEDGEEYLGPIEDDEEFEAVSGIFVERLSDRYNFHGE